jgi:hypothetical protein
VKPGTSDPAGPVLPPGGVTPPSPRSTARSRAGSCIPGGR